MRTVSYTYDAVGNRTSVTDYNGHTTYFTYDALNRLLSETDPLGQTTYYQYDKVGNRTFRAIEPNSLVVSERLYVAPIIGSHSSIVSGVSRSSCLVKSPVSLSVIFLCAFETSNQS